MLLTISVLMIGEFLISGWGSAYKETKNMLILGLAGVITLVVRKIR